MSAPAPAAPALPVRWRLLTILTASYGAGAFGMLGISPLSPSLVEGFGLTRFQVAFLVPSIYLAGLLFSLPGGRLADRLGVRPAFLGGLAVGAIGLLAAALAPGFLAFLFCLFVAGAGWSVVNPALGKAIIDVFPVHERGIAMGVKQMGLTLGGLLAALALPAIAAALGWRYAIGALLGDRGGAGRARLAPARRVQRGRRAAPRSPAGATGAGSSWWWAARPALVIFFARRLRARHGPGRGAELPAALHDPGARLRQDRRRAARRRLAGGRRGLPSRPGRGQRSLGRGTALAAGSPSRAPSARSSSWSTRSGPPPRPAWRACSPSPTGVGAYGWVGIFFVISAEAGGRGQAGLLSGVAFASIVLGLLVGPPIFGLLLEAFDSYAVAWAVFAALSGLVALVSLLAGPAIDRESHRP